MPQQNTSRSAPPEVDSTASASTLLHRAHAQNEAAQSALEESANELGLVNTVLKQELPEHVQSDDVALALEKSDELETRIQDTAQDLADVNEALSQEIATRAALESELARTKAALEEARQDTQSS